MCRCSKSGKNASKRRGLMTESKNERIAIFRFGVICEFVGGARLDRDQRRQLMRDKCQRKWTIPYSSSTRISRSTIYRWIRRVPGKQRQDRIIVSTPKSRSGQDAPVRRRDRCRYRQRKSQTARAAGIASARSAQATGGSSADHRADHHLPIASQT